MSAPADQPKRKLGFYLDPVIPHVVAGGPQWQTTFIFHNPSDEPEKFYLNFHGDDGKPVQMPILGSLYPSLIVTLPPHATYKVGTDYRPEVTERWGSAVISDPYTCSDCNFRYTTVHTIFALYDWLTQTYKCEATVPQESQYENKVVLIYDQVGFTTSVANSKSEYLRSQEGDCDHLRRCR